MTTAETRDSAIRDAKRYIREIVRNDWTFEPGAKHPYPPATPLCADREVTEWRLREYGSSGSELEMEPDPEPYPASPTAVQDDEDEMGIGADRRRKRRKQMEEEMSWNEGLKTWMDRRDAWCGARSRKCVRGKPGEKSAKGKAVADASSGAAAAAGTGPVPVTPVGDEVDDNGKRPVGAVSTSAVSDSSSRGIEGRKGDEDEAIASRTEALTLADKDGSQQPQSTPQDKEGDHSTADPEEKRKESTETPITEPDHHPASSPSEEAVVDDEESEDEPEDPLIPVVPSIISTTNPIRASINQAMFPSIYSKVVVQGLTPTVPINLADVTKAMVQGWKSDGQWPSRPATTNIVLQDDATVKKPTESKDGPTAGGSTETKRRRSSGVANAVRKVLHFSGHPFHRRGSSHDQHQNAAEGGR